MDHAVVTYRRDRHARLVQLARIGFAFITQHVGTGGLNQRRWQTFQLLGGGAQRLGVDLVALRGIGGVVVPEPLHHVTGQEVAFGVLVV